MTFGAYRGGPITIKVTLPEEMLEDIDRAAMKLGVSTKEMILILLHQALG